VERKNGWNKNGVGEKRNEMKKKHPAGGGMFL
jgi:hypothetical protein